ncbi:hypothetical protein [Sphingopyxis sp.]|nr:hypothetical protein [Sphingopyxis sp.]
MAIMVLAWARTGLAALARAAVHFSRQMGLKSMQYLLNFVEKHPNP